MLGMAGQHPSTAGVGTSHDKLRSCPNRATQEWLAPRREGRQHTAELQGTERQVGGAMTAMQSWAGTGTDMQCNKAAHRSTAGL
jgi:hypothetical protein